MCKQAGKPACQVSYSSMYLLCRIIGAYTSLAHQPSLGPIRDTSPAASLAERQTDEQTDNTTTTTTTTTLAAFLPPRSPPSPPQFHLPATGRGILYSQRPKSLEAYRPCHSTTNPIRRRKEAASFFTVRRNTRKPAAAGFIAPG